MRRSPLFASLTLSARLALLAAPAAVQAQAGSPAGPIPVATLQARREALLARLGNGIAILRSADDRSIEGDYPQDSDYRENNDFFYLTGIESPNSILVLVASDTAPDQVVLYIPPRNPATEQWTGYKFSQDSARVLTGITDIHSADSAQQLIRRQVARSRTAGGALYIRRTAHTGEDDFLRGLVFGGGIAITVKDINPELAALRLVKDADELRRMRATINATLEAHRDAARALVPGMWEYQLEAIIEAAFRRNGAERVGFPSIVGSGPNSVTLHYDKNRRQMQSGDLVVVDIGAEWGYYSADVTRTYPVNGRFTPRQREVYELVRATQQAAIDSIRPGITIGQLNQISRNYMKEHSGQICGGEDCTKYYIHSLSHWLGMDVHDVGAYNTPLAPGMILTVEPGIYIAAENLGVRIEDDVLVTATGHEVLSAAAPRDPAEIERLMRAGRR